MQKGGTVPNERSQPRRTGLAENLRQEVEFILAQATKEPWVIREAEAIASARAVKAAWERALGSVS